MYLEHKKSFVIIYADVTSLLSMFMIHFFLSCLKEGKTFYVIWKLNKKNDKKVKGDLYTFKNDTYRETIHENENILSVIKKIMFLITCMKEYLCVYAKLTICATVLWSCNIHKSQSYLYFKCRIPVDNMQT